MLHLKNRRGAWRYTGPPLCILLMELTDMLPLRSAKVVSTCKDCDGEVDDLFAHHFDHPNLVAEGIVS